MARHTPGPWVAVGRMVEVVPDDVPDICACNPGLFGQGHLNRSEDEACANARLIAAAPDLFEALTLILENPDHDLLDIERETAEAAIAKAEGGSQ